MRFVRAVLAVLATFTLFVAISAPAGAAERQPASPARGEPTAHAACPICVVGAVAIGRAALAVRAASTAPTIVRAGLATRAAVGNLAARVTRATVRRVQRSARRISRKGKDWIKNNWPRFKPEVKGCLSTVAFFEAAEFLKDNLLSRREWSRYVAFGPRLVPPLESLSINFPIRFDQFASDAAREAAECAVGIGFAHHYARNQ